MTKLPLIELVATCYREGSKFQVEDTKILNPFDGSDLESTWYYCDRFYRGFQYDLSGKMAGWASRPVKNIAKIGVETYTTLLTDSRPTFTVIPREPNDEDLADIVEAVVNYWYDIEAFEATVALAVKASRIYGIGWFYTYYDEEMKRPRVRFIHPENIFVDPDCTVDDFNPTYIVYSYRAQVGDLFANKDYTIDKSTFDPDWNIGMPYGDEALYARKYDNTNPATSCQVYELWYRDPTRIEWEAEVNSDEVAVGTKPKYKGGRRIIVAGGQVINDDKNPNAHGQMPFTPIHAYPEPGRFYGRGDIHDLINIQVMRNRMSQFIFDATVRSGGGYVLVGQGSGIDSDKVNNAPIQILPCRDVNQFRVERAPTPSRHVFDYIGMLDTDAMDVMAIHDITQGKQGQGNPATAQEIAIISESDRTRVRMASRWLTWAIKRVGHQVLALMAQYPDFEWMVTVAGMQPVPGDPETEEMVTSQVPFEGRMIAKRENGSFTKEMIDMDLIVADTSMLPATQQEKMQNLEMWIGMGLVTPEDALKYNLTNIPPQIADQILADREAQMAAQAEMPTDENGNPLPPEQAGGQITPDMLNAALQAPPPAPTGGEAPPMPPELMMQGGSPDEMMEGAMSGMPTDFSGMSPEDILEMVEAVAQTNGMAPEEVLSAMGLAGAGGQV